MKSIIGMWRSIGSIVLLIGLFFIIGCKPETTGKATQNPISELIFENPLIQPEVQILIDRATRLSSFEYYYIGPEVTEKRYYYEKARDVKVVLPEPKHLPSGEIYDEIFLDKYLKVAFAHCSKKTCSKERDKTAEPVAYEPYDITFPREIVLNFDTASIIGEEMLGNHHTKIVSYTAPYGVKGKAWLQAYYGVPLKVEFTDRDGINKTIIYEDINWNTIRLVHIILPFNTTVIYGDGQDFQVYNEPLSSKLSLLE